MDRRVTSPTWSPPPPCKQVPKTIKSRMCLECMNCWTFRLFRTQILEMNIKRGKLEIVFLERKLNKQNYNCVTSDDPNNGCEGD